MTPLHRITLIFTCLLCHGIAAAGEMTLRLLDLRGDQARGDLFLQLPSKILHLKSKGLNLTPPLVLKQGTIRILIGTTREQLESPDAHKQAVIAEFGEQWSRAVVLITPSTQAEIPFRAVCINASPSAFPAGSLFFANLTPGRLEARLGTQATQILANTTALVAPPMTEDGDYPVRIYHQVRPDEPPRPLIMGTWRREPATRQFVFAVDDSATGRARLFSVPDDPEEPAMRD